MKNLKLNKFMSVNFVKDLKENNNLYFLMILFIDIHRYLYKLKDVNIIKYNQINLRLEA